MSIAIELKVLGLVPASKVSSLPGHICFSFRPHRQVDINLQIQDDVMLHDWYAPWAYKPACRSRLDSTSDASWAVYWTIRRICWSVFTIEMRLALALFYGGAEAILTTSRMRARSDQASQTTRWFSIFILYFPDLFPQSAIAISNTISNTISIGYWCPTNLLLSPSLSLVGAWSL